MGLQRWGGGSSATSPLNPDLGSKELFPATSLDPKIGAILRKWFKRIASSKAQYKKQKGHAHALIKKRHTYL